MELGRTFFVSLFSGLVTLVLLCVGVNLPTQLEFESRPFARAVLVSGQLGNWTAEALGLTSGQFDLVKQHYTEFLKRNRNEDDSFSDDSDDSDDSELEEWNASSHHPSMATSNMTDVELNDVIRVDSSSSSDDDVNGVSSSDDDDAETIRQRLESKPVLQTVGLGLFHGRVCKTLRGQMRGTCSTISTTEGMFLMNHEVSFMESDINMPMWNNLRVESLFSIVACVIGIVCLVMSLRPCCDNKRLPVYLGALAFCASGILVFIPMVRLLLLRSDFEQNLKQDLNVTTELMTSWSLVTSGLAIPFALLAAFALIAMKWVRATRHWYALLKNKFDEERNGDVRMKTMDRKSSSGNGCAAGNVDTEEQQILS